MTANRHGGYGSTRLTGTASAHLGDSFHSSSQSFNIQQASFILVDHDSETHGTLKRKHHDTVLDGGYACCAKCVSSDDRYRPTKRRRLIQGNKTWTKHLLDRIVSPTIHDSRLQTARTVDLDDWNITRDDEEMLEPPTETPEILVSIARARSLAVAVPVAFASAAILRHTSLESVFTDMSHALNVAAIPLAGGLLVSWLMYEMTKKSLRDQPVLQSDSCVPFEDVYGRTRNLPMSYFEHTEILEAFFNVHYRSSSVATLIKDGQFHLTRDTPDRRRKPRTMEAICSSKRPPSYLRMYIVYRVGSKNCLECLNVLKYQRTDGSSVW